MDDVRLGETLVRKARWRVLPVLILCVFVAFLDWANVGFAAPQTNWDLGLTPDAYGFGAGLSHMGALATPGDPRAVLPAFAAILNIVALACFGVVVFVVLTVAERRHAGPTGFRTMAAPTGAEV